MVQGGSCRQFGTFFVVFAVVCLLLALQTLGIEVFAAFLQLSLRFGVVQGAWPRIPQISTSTSY